MGVTMRDVARQAGVSVATVSRALAGSSSVSPEVRDRVERAARELNYVASRLPANLRARSSLIFALVVGNVRNPYFPDLIGGCEEAAQRAGYSLVFGDSDEDPERESVVLRQLAVERVAGIVLAAASAETEGLGLVLAAGIPVVAVDRRIAGLDLDTVTVDNEPAVCDAVRHLVELGHRRIAMIGGPPDVSTALERQAGYIRGLTEAGITPDPALLVNGDFRAESAHRIATDLMATEDPPSAIVTVNNLATLGALQALRALGHAVPDDVSVVSFDDLLAGDLLDPPLTAIAQPTTLIGRTAIELLLARIASPEAPVADIVLLTSLLVRGSTGPARSPRRTGSNEDLSLSTGGHRTEEARHTSTS